MARLHLFAEGTTELVFARDVLVPHLARLGVYLHKPVLVAKARKRGKVHRGGGASFRRMQNDIERRLKEDRSADVYFTTMIDLYALHQDFPGREEADHFLGRPYDRVTSLENSWQVETADSRFLPFIQLHEFETYLFTEVAKLAEFFDESNRGIEELQHEADGAQSPELIDEGQHTAPSKRIIARFPTYESLKTTVGPQMAALIGLPKIRSACPHFDRWLGRLEQLASAPP